MISTMECTMDQISYFQMDDIQVVLPRLKAMTWDMANQESAEVADPVAVINLKVCD